MANAITPVEFHGATLSATIIDGVPFVAMRPICEAIGLDWAAQFTRIKRQPVLAKGVVVTTTPSAGGDQQTVMLPLSLLNGWLFGVSVSRVKPELRERLTQYQAECFDVLARHFGAAPAAPPALPAPLPPADVLSILGMASAMGALVQQTVFKSLLAEGADWKNGRWVMEFIKDSEWAAPPVFRRLNDDEHITTAADIAGALIAGEFSRPELLAIANASAQRLYVQVCTDGAKGIGAQVRQLINGDLSQTDLREIVTSAALELWIRAMPEKAA